MDRTLSLKLAPVSEQDLDRLVEIGRASAERIGDTVSFTRPDLLAMLAWSRLGPEGLLLIRDEGVVIGMVRYLRFLDATTPAVVGYVTVDPEFRRDGVGDWAYRQLLERAQADGAHALDSVADSQDKESIGFLNRRGFEKLISIWTLEADPDFAPAEAPRAPEGYRLRNYRPGEDAGVITDIHNHAFAEHVTFIHASVAEMQSLEATPHFNPELTLILETADGTPVGFARNIIRGEVRDAWVDILGVVPEYQGRGLGRFLLLAAMYRVAQARPKSIRLSLEAINERARALYDSEGFMELRTRIRYRKKLA